MQPEEPLDYTELARILNVDVRQEPMGVLILSRGEARSAIDTTDMTRDEVIRSIRVALAQIEDQLKESGLNRHKRRRAQALTGVRLN